MLIIFYSKMRFFIFLFILFVFGLIWAVETRSDLEIDFSSMGALTLASDKLTQTQIRQPCQNEINRTNTGEPIEHSWYTKAGNDFVGALEMNPNRSPEYIKILLTTSPDQYASLGHTRALGYPGARSIRGSSEKP